MLQLDYNRRYSCSLSSAGGALLLAGNGAKAWKGHKDLIAKSGQSPEYFFTAIGEVNTYLYVFLAGIST